MRCVDVTRRGGSLASLSSLFSCRSYPDRKEGPLGAPCSLRQRTTLSVRRCPRIWPKSGPRERRGTSSWRYQCGLFRELMLVKLVS